MLSVRDQRRVAGGINLRHSDQTWRWTEDMRLYFDLRTDQDTIPDIPDVYGIEVADVEEARREALRTIRELRQESPSVAQNWSGWWMSVVDATGSVFFTLVLSGIV